MDIIICICVFCDMKFGLQTLGDNSTEKNYVDSG